MIKTSVIQTFCKMDSEKLSFGNKLTKQLPCSVKNGDFYRFGVLWSPFTNSTEASQMLDCKFIPTDSSSKSLKDVTNITSSFVAKETIESNVTTNLPETNIHEQNVQRNNTEASNYAGKITLAGFLPSSISEIVNTKTDDMVMDNETNRNHYNSSPTTEDLGIYTEGTGGLEISSATTDGLEISSSITDELGLRNGSDYLEISSATTGGLEISSATTDGFGLGISTATTDGFGIGISSATTDGLEISSATTGGLEIRSATTGGLEISSATTGGLELEISSGTADTLGISGTIAEDLGISIVITDVTGISSAFTYDTQLDRKTTNVTKTYCKEIDTTEIINGKDYLTIMNSETTGYPVKRNETNNFKNISNETEILNDNNQRIKDKTTDSILKVGVKSLRTEGIIRTFKETIVKVNTAHTSQAKTVIKFKSKIPKAPKRVLKTFAKTMERTHIPKPASYSNIDKSIEAKTMLVDNNEMKNCVKESCDIEKFLNAVDLTNKDMVKKSGILLKKQKLVAEVLSYVHAVQSIFRLSSPKCLFTDAAPRDGKTGMGMSSDKQFHEAGNYILDELKIYQRELKRDFKDWEACRMEILGISESMPCDFEQCENDKSVRVLMHEFTSEICNILKKMEIISSKSQEKNEECVELMDGIDTYIKYSSAFIMGENTLTVL